MQVVIELDDGLIAEGLFVTGLKNEPDLIERGIKELIKIYQANLKENKKSWLGCMRNEGKIIGDIVSPVLNENDWEVG